MINDVITGQIGEFGNDIVFVNRNIIHKLHASVEAEVGDNVVGHIQKRNIAKNYEHGKKMIKEFHLIAKAKKGKVAKDRIRDAVIKFVNLHGEELDRFNNWGVLNEGTIFNKGREKNVIYTRHLYIFLTRFLTNKTLVQISKDCNYNQNCHASVINGNIRVQDRLATNMFLMVNFQSLVDECLKTN